MRTCIATCVKNEGRYLLEWIAWHKLCGFDEIVIYDNLSTDDTTTLLRPIADARLIHLGTLRDEAGVPPQITAFRREMRRHANNEWVMFADADEFLVLPDGELISDLLRNCSDDVAQVCFNWRIFGSSGHARMSDEPVVQRFTWGSSPLHVKNKHVKSITRRVCMKSPDFHAPHLRWGTSVHDDGQPVEFEERGITRRVSFAKGYVHHYVVKSREEYDQKISRGRGAIAVGAPNKIRPDAEGFWTAHDANEVESLVAAQRAPELIATMNTLRKIGEMAAKSTSSSSVAEAAHVNTPKSLYEGYIDAAWGYRVMGWARRKDLVQPVHVVLVVDGVPVSERKADQYRPDLERAGKNNGYCAFNFELVEPIAEDSDVHVEVLGSEASLRLRTAS